MAVYYENFIDSKIVERRVLNMIKNQRINKIRFLCNELCSNYI